MKVCNVRNTSSKIINIGNMLVLPDSTVEIPENMNNESIRALERMGLVRITEEVIEPKPKKAEKKVEAVETPVEEKPAEEAPVKKPRKKKTEVKAESEN